MESWPSHRTIKEVPRPHSLIWPLTPFLPSSGVLKLSQPFWSLVKYCNGKCIPSSSSEKILPVYENPSLIDYGLMLLLLLVCHFSRVWLCETAWTAAPWLAFPWDSPGKNTGVGCHFPLQCMHACMLSRFSCVDSAILWTAAPRLLCPRDTPGKNTGVGCHFLLLYGLILEGKKIQQN